MPTEDNSSNPSAASPSPTAPKLLRPRKLGKTGLELTELSLGTWGLSGEGYGANREDETDATIERALALGINTFDTSDAYNRGEMERRLGTILSKHVAPTIVITRHGTDRSGEVATKRFDPAYLDATIKKSSERLQRSCIEVLLLHNPSVSAVVKSSTRDFLGQARGDGRIRAWGVSTSSAEVARTAMSLGAEVISFPYNVLSGAELHSIIGEIVKYEVGVLAHSVLSYGLLAGMWYSGKTFAADDHRRDRWTPDELNGRLKHLEAVRFLLGGEVTTMRGASLRFVLENAKISSAILGPRSVNQLEQLVRECGKAPPYLPIEKLQGLPSKLLDVGADLLAMLPVSRRRWFWWVAGAPWVPRVASAAPGFTPPPRTTDLEVFDWTFSKTTPFIHRASVLVPTHLKPGEKVRTLVLLHGLGEALEGPTAGVFAWIDRYGAGTSYTRLRNPPLVSVEKGNYLSSERAQEITNELKKKAFPGLVIVCPYLANVWAIKVVPALDALAKFITGDLLAKVESDIDCADTSPTSTAIDGCSLGGFGALEVFKRAPSRFGALGMIQPAMTNDNAPVYASMIASAYESGSLKAIHVESSSGDPYLEPSKILAAQLKSKNVPATLRVPPGPHDQSFLRDVGTLESLHWHASR
ncbi:MAG: aldo/keto reductase [Polyangiaceae bacterium]